jgi:hypothetical protein
MASNAGKIFLAARSPVAPKKTKASDFDSLITDYLSKKTLLT